MKMLIVLLLVSVVSACTTNHPCTPTGKVQVREEPVGDDEVLPRQYQFREYVCTQEAHWI